MKYVLLILISCLMQNALADNFKKQIIRSINEVDGFWAVDDAESVGEDWHAKIYFNKRRSSFGCVTSVNEVNNSTQPVQISKKIAFSTMECELSGARNFLVEATQSKKSPSAIFIFDKVVSKALKCVSAKGCDLASSIDVKNLLKIIVNDKGVYLEFGDTRAELLRVYLNDDMKIIKIYLDRI